MEIETKYKLGDTVYLRHRDNSIFKCVITGIEIQLSIKANDDGGHTTIINISYRTNNNLYFNENDSCIVSAISQEELDEAIKQREIKDIEDTIQYIKQRIKTDEENIKKDNESVAKWEKILKDIKGE